MKKSPKSGTYDGYNNRPYKVMAPEDMPDELMAFTFNPKIVPCMKGDIYMMDIYHNDLMLIFGSLRYAKIKLYHEISCMGKWHLHGYIQINNKMKFTLFDLPHLKENGVFEIDTISDKDKWKTYVFKQKTLMQEILSEYKIPYEINSIDGKLLHKKIDPLQKMAKSVKVELDDLSDDI